MACMNQSQDLRLISTFGNHLMLAAESHNYYILIILVNTFFIQANQCLLGS